LGLPPAATIEDVERQFTDVLPPELRALHDRLMGEHKALAREFEELTRNPFDIAAHEKFLDKLTAHRSALHQHSAEIHRHADWLHEQREVLHAAHDSHAPRTGPSKRKWTWGRGWPR